MITRTRLTELLSYCSETGCFTWIAKTTKFSKVQIGDVAGTTSHHKGYVYIKIDGKQYAAHRLAWLYVYGELPKDQIDHINRNRSDNRIQNLRHANNAQNAINRKIRSDNKSGYRGVCFDKQKNKWRSYISLNGKLKTIGYFFDINTAIIARKNKELNCHYAGWINE